MGRIGVVHACEGLVGVVGVVSGSCLVLSWCWVSMHVGRRCVLVVMGRVDLRRVVLGAWVLLAGRLRVLVGIKGCEVVLTGRGGA